MLIFAHRGASGVEPENTLRAIRTALAAEVDGIEIDIYQVDGKLFVIDDRWLHRTTSGQGQIFNYDYQYLSSLDAGGGEVIPTLDQVLQLIARKCTINIELKAVKNLTLLFSYIDDAINTTALLSNDVLFSSFNHRSLDAIHQQRSDFAIGALTACYPLDYAKFTEQLNAYSVHLETTLLVSILSLMLTNEA
ncbi:MAG: glycerophosphoryl diester phosphodiesterase [Colwellia sp.]|jgi:glycerophosphoryl diester phosphodiesterase